MKKIFFPIIALVLTIMCYDDTAAQSKKKVLIDIGHGQKFYNDPALMQGQDSMLVQRIRYMTGELSQNANALGAETTFIKTSITSQALKNCDVLFIHMPSKNFTADEVGAIQHYLNRGGAMFMVMEVDYWAKLEQANVNDIVTPFGITYRNDNPDTESSGGYSEPGLVTKQKYSIPYHGARIIEGGTPFCFSNLGDKNSFGVYKEIKKGGKIVAMGDGMTSLYMTSWKDVNNYQCKEFMGEVLAWLMK